MLNITVLAVGRDKDRWVSEAVAHYEKLLARWCRLAWRIVPSPKHSAALSPEEIRRAESARLRAALGPGYIAALAASGRTVDSPAFARLLERWHTVSGSNLTFVIGGPHGLDRDLLSRADTVLSLSPLTFSHQLVRLILLEQLYRAFSILHGTDYHK
ncbi:MAG TPA: 23S rRNA (pseudouridine(1915)-N(3))-methyltransferase RlmH [candidate division Zixibacteria bacterium]|nr:23S rRNA (pseudouridine(1915)-N(3))-methyltransferase RlmH [candidate division Zixibacteria bacterium]MDD4916907.1 23S rRNA (pseudouridine(1915)-N(3))-methyltransferase RlmH [candidate division Zixibacteria bacterium]MDM7972151.1 23S rRNA (pseudouridine(1915)-N(3))-methyltransferase RlmH [candidate division Zixibacteria bacterium]HOD66729.1 23S rRNA (pseudouridine(1915)-N(3))-methyltransferase RlmH [candidate division Zixibacteria bacterium]HPC10621.1 23S rRNA (pseudouridine(1915)-N(3))-meth